MAAELGLDDKQERGVTSSMVNVTSLFNKLDKLTALESEGISVYVLLRHDFTGIFWTF